MHILQDKWQDGRRWQLIIATELPELEESMRNRGERGFGARARGHGGFRSGFRSGFRGGNNRRGGGRGGGRGAAQKRNFSQAFDY